MILLPRVPPRLAHRPHDSRGYPVPWFVQWFKDGQPSAEGVGEPDFRVVGPGKIGNAWRASRCWICGEPLGRHKVYVIGPMCVVNRVTSEPPSHRECAEFAAKTCPFLTNPREKRDHKDLPADGKIAGIPIMRNPGAVCLYETRTAQPTVVKDGVLFELGPPDRIDWYARGRRATRAEIEESIRTGYPLLLNEARKDGVDAIRALERMCAAAMQFLPAT